jgi:hypothetical protein
VRYLRYLDFYHETAEERALILFLCEHACNLIYAGICRLFHKIGMEETRTMSRSELHAFVIGIKFVEIDLDRRDAMDAVDRIMTSAQITVAWWRRTSSLTG